MYKEDRYSTFGGLREAVEYAVTRMADLEYPVDFRAAFTRSVSVRLGDDVGYVIASISHRWEN